MSESRGKLEGLRKERDSFIALITKLDGRLLNRQITSHERHILINSVTKGESRGEYLQKLDHAVSALEKQLKPAKKPYPHKKNIMASAAVLAVFLAIFFSLQNAGLTGFTAFGVEKRSVISVDEFFNASTVTAYEFNIDPSGNLTSLKVTGGYNGRFRMLLQKDYGNHTQQYLIYESPPPSENLITGMVAGDAPVPAASNITENETAPVIDDVPSPAENASNESVPETVEAPEIILDSPKTKPGADDTINETAENIALPETGETFNETAEFPETNEVAENAAAPEADEAINETIINETIESDEAIPMEEFSSECIETCQMFLRAGNLSIIIEVYEDSMLYLEEMAYTIFKPNSPPLLIKDIPDVVSNTTLNLSEYFTDPDNDPLMFDVSSVDGADYALSRGMLMLNPSGDASMFVYATDGKDIIRSNEFNIYANLTVNYSKISPDVLDALKSQKNVRIIIKSKNKAKSVPAKSGDKGLGISAQKKDKDISSVLNVNVSVPIEQETSGYVSVISDISLLEELSLSPDVEGIVLDTPYSMLGDSIAMNITRIIDVNSLGLLGVGQTICIVDTGADAAVLGLTDGVNIRGYNVLAGSYDYSDDNGHGTSVADAAVNSAPGADYVIAKVIDANGLGYASDVIAGLEYCAAQNASIVSLSIGGGSFSGYCDEDIVASEVNGIVASGVLVVAATGNDGLDSVKSPACARGALPVGASTKDDGIAGFSNFNNATLLVAPGQDIQTMDNDGQAVAVSGTSMSVPFVSGAAALILENRTLPAFELRDLLVHAGDMVNNSQRYFSRLNVLNALASNITNNLTPGKLAVERGTAENFVPLSAVFSTRIASSSDDSEEAVSNGQIDTTSSDLEITLDASNAPFNPQLVGLRFPSVTIPQGATINNATIQFHVDSTTGGTTAVTIRFSGEDIDDALAFPPDGTSAYNISSRPETTATVDWAVPSWLAVHDEGVAQLSPDLSTIVQEIVDRPGWASGNAMVILIKTVVSGTGHREAESWDGENPSAPLITINYTVAADASPNVTLSLPADASTDADGNISFQCNVTDDNDIANVTLYTNISGSFISNQTVAVSGSSDTSYSANFTINNTANNGYIWNCLAFDNNTQTDWGDSNFTYTVSIVAGSGIQYDNGDGANGVDQTLTISGFVVGEGSNKVLIAMTNFRHDGTEDVNNISWNGNEMFTEVASVSDSTLVVQLWYLVNPTSTTADIVATGSVDPTTRQILSVVSLTGVDQSNPVPTNATGTNSDWVNYGINITTQYENSWLVGATCPYNANLAVTADYTSIYEYDGSPSMFASRRALTSTGTYSLTWTGTGVSDAGLVIGEIKAATVAYPNRTNFDGATTNFTVLTSNQLANLTNTTLEMSSFGRIVWNSGVNVLGADFDTHVKMGTGFIYVNSSGLNATMNSSANLTIYNAPYPNLRILKDGALCTDCTFISHSGNNYSFSVTSFSNYSLTMNITLIDPTDGNASVSSPVFFVSNVTDVNEILNATLYTNESGTFAAVETRWNGEINRNDTSLKLLYHFNNESAFGENGTLMFDFSGNGNNGSCTTCPIFKNNGGKLGGAFNFTPSQPISVSSAVLNGIKNVTVAFWMNSSPNNGPILGQPFNFYTSSTKYWGMRFTGTDYLQINYNINGDSGNAGGHNHGASSWHFIVAQMVQMNSTTFENRLYSDGVEKGTRTNVTGTWPDIAGTLYVGAKSSSGGLNGTIDEFAVWNRTLSDAEIAALYNYTKTKFYPVFQNRTLSNGTYIWNVLGYDNNSQSAWASSNFTYTVSIAAPDASPTVFLNNPTDGNSSVTSPVFFISNASDDNNVLNATLYTNESGTFAAKETRWNGEINYNDTDLKVLFHFNNESAYGESGSLVYDWTGNGNNGTPTSGPAYSDSGKFSKGMNFTDANSWVSIGNQDYFHACPLTISVWFKLDTLPSTAGHTFDIFHLEGDPSNNPPIVGNVQSTTDKIRVAGRDSGGGFISVDGNDALQTGQYYHLVTRCNETGTLKIFIDGIKDSSSDIFDDIQNSSQLFAIGSNNGGSLNTEGVIDEFSMWNRSLNDAEITALYNYTKTKYYPAFQNRSLNYGNYTWNVLAFDNNSQSDWGNSNFTFLYKPVLSAAGSISPTIAYTNDTLLGYCVGNTSDSSTTLKYHYQWFRNTVANASGSVSGIANGTTYNVANISSSNTVKGDNWIIGCRVEQFSINSSWINSTAVSVLNTAPVINSSRIAPAIAYVNDTLLGYCNATDIDADNVLYHYKWFLNSVSNTTGSTSSYAPATEINVANISSSYLVAWQNWTLECKADDGSGNSSALNSSQVTINNTAPALTSIADTEELLGPSQTQTITPSGQSDIDSDLLTLACCKGSSDTCTPTTGSNICTGGNYASQSSPYSSMSCTYAVGTSQGTEYVRCRVYDGLQYSATTASENYVVDATDPTCSISSIDELANPSYQYVSGSTVYYNTITTGTFMVNVSADDTGGGSVANVTFPATVSAGYADTSTPYNLSYSWATDDTYSQAATVTVYDTVANSNTCSFTVTRDVAPPSGGSITYANVTQPNVSIDLTYSTGSDSGSGLNTGTGNILRQECTVSSGRCVPSGSWSSIVTEFDGSYTDTGTSGKCYSYMYNIDDNVANEVNYTNSSIICVNSIPVVSSVVLASSSGDNITTDNLSVTFTQSDVDNDALFNVTDWRRNGTSIAVLNLPFNNNISTSAVGGLKDFTTHSNNMTLGGGTAGYVPTWTSNGKVGGAYNFDGVDDFINASDNTDFNSLKNLTVAFWINSTDTDSVSYVFSKYKDGSNSWGVRTTSSGTWLAIYDDINNVNGTGAPGTSITLGTWTHIVVVMEAVNTSHYANYLYKNAALDSERWNSSGSWADYVGNLNIGGESGSGSSPLNATLDEFMIFNRSLTQEQITEIYLAGLANHSVDTLVSNETVTGDVWSVAVTASDTYNDSATVVSNTLSLGTQCRVLSNPNQVVSMTEDASITGATCFNVQAANVTINCNGHSITGDNTSSTYGVYSNQYNTTVKNCNINNFQRGIYFNGATNGTIQNNNVSTTQNGDWYDGGYAILLHNSANGNILSNNNLTAPQFTILLNGSSSYNQITQNNITSSASQAITFQGGTQYNTVSGNNLTGTGGIAAQSSTSYNIITDNKIVMSGSRGIDLSFAANNNNITNNNITGSGYGISLWAGAHNNRFINNSITSSNTYAVYSIINWNPNNNNTFINNTFTSASIVVNAYNLTNSSFIRNKFVSSSQTTTLLQLDVSASANTFYWNNFTSTSSYYVSDTSGSNFYNSSIPGQNEGNIWANVMDESVQVVGTIVSNYGSGLYIGEAGSGYPYNTTNAGGKLSGTIVDYAPLTIVNNSIPVMNTSTILPSPAYVNTTLLGYCNATDADDVTLYYYYSWFLNGASNTTGTAGPFSQAINTNVANISTSQLAVGQNWTLECKADDLTANSTPLNSSTTMIVARTPEQVTLIAPTNGNTTVHNRTPEFSWNPSNLTTYYEVNITAVGGCQDMEGNVSTTTYTPTTELCVNSDPGSPYYLWSVRACSPDACGIWSDTWNFTIEPYVVITLVNDTIDFGSVVLGEIQDTTDNTPSAFVLQNDGNVEADLVNISAQSSLWSSGLGPLGTRYMQIKARNSSEIGSFNNSLSLMDWVNLTSSNQSIIRKMNYNDSIDSALVDLLVEVPGDEPPGSKSTSVTFAWEQTP